MQQQLSLLLSRAATRSNAQQRAAVAAAIAARSQCDQ